MLNKINGTYGKKWYSWNKNINRPFFFIAEEVHILTNFKYLVSVPKIFTGYTNRQSNNFLPAKDSNNIHALKIITKNIFGDERTALSAVIQQSTND